ncbi:MAG: DNA mismatch repair endonuclease MutL [Candidatus Omnitrophota bacterium]|nr:DNA mismatch repair endonuclease MutL [Candidatus Omnitrophota bacterium]MBU2527795.1 DNA mismatch repair endonuclease MutL [bacterium]MBU3930405.1 DNA mismatch repair endonuclease MutL [bacterium]MBU4123256.1 DNA mismatch repair endonuclease MutL [bacterium]
MPRINVLPEEVRNYISCGEVIESPASVVKELVENALDAGADRIDVKALEAGLGFISVTDNGSGMDFEDLKLSLEPFATSKIKVKNDISSVQSLGFRGEALASIANVAAVKIFSSTGSTGAVILSEGGREIDHREFSCPRGTTVEVRKLFFNAPVRKRFLKSPKYMNGEILRVVREYALSRPEIVFSLRIDDKNYFDDLSSSDDEKERVRKIFGFENADYAALENPMMGLRCFAYPEDYKSSRRFQFIFVNRRPISNAAFLKAAENAFEGYLPRGKHPPLFIYLTAASGLIDVNVHPAKREIRFQSPRAFYQMVYDVLRNKYSRNQSAVYPLASGTDTTSELLPRGAEGSSDIPSASLFENGAVKESVAPEPFPGTPVGPRWDSFRYVGKSHGKFLIFSTFDALHIMDFHAAAERINYEKIKQKIKQGNVASQKLLVQIEVKLSTDEAAALQDNSDILIKLGLALKYYSGSVFISAVPAGFTGSEKDMLEKISACLLEGKKHHDIFESLADRAVKIIACHMSFRAGDDIKPHDAETLIQELKKCSEPLRCPHGRPVMFSIPVSKIDSILRR